MREAFTPRTLRLETKFRSQSFSFLLPRGIGELYVDLEGFRSPSEVTGDSKRPDVLIVKPESTLYLVELTVCYETNMPKNAQIKLNRYETTIEHLKVEMT